MIMRKKKTAAPNPASSSVPAPVPQAAPAPKPRAAKAPKKQVVIDHPIEGEIIRSHTYTFRIGATPTDRVEVSIDGKEWRPCRPSVGYWWFDWSGYNAGPHRIKARIPGAGNRFVASKPRQVTVLI